MSLHEMGEQQNMLQTEHADLELEHESLLKRNNQFVQEISAKETGWKRRLDVFEYKDKTFVF